MGEIDKMGFSMVELNRISSALGAYLKSGDADFNRVTKRCKQKIDDLRFTKAAKAAGI